MLEGGYTIRKDLDTLEIPLISVVTVCHNAGQLLRQCINSISDQEYKGIEHIVIDGASSDNTIEILKEHEGRIAYWRSEKDEGIYDAMNKALQFVRGKWIIFLGADDQLLPDFSKIVPYLKDDNTLYYSNVYYDTIPVGRKINGFFLAKNNICHQSILYPRTVFEKYRFKEKYILYADHYLNMQCWSDCKFKFEYCDLLTARFATDGASSRRKDLRFMQDKSMLIKEHFGNWSYCWYLFKEFKTKSIARIVPHY
jgi:glycosyltransferase involved in cell wall biosynthesis